MSELKGLLVIMDGLGDRPHPKLGDRTPLESARTPTMDEWARNGRCGLVYSLTPWMPVGTQIGVGMLLGLRPADGRRLPRGPVEAAGVGMKLNPGDVAVRANLASLRRTESRLGIANRRAGRIEQGTDEIATALEQLDLGNGIQTQFQVSTQHRGVLLLRGPDLSDAVSDTDPGAGRADQGVLVCEPLDDSTEARRTADAINRFTELAYELLQEMPVNNLRRRQGLPPANGVLLRGAGRSSRFTSMLAGLGIHAAVVTGDGTVIGLSRLFGFDVLTKPSFTAKPKTDIDGKIRAGIDALESHDLVVIHLKGPDVAAHDLEPRTKQNFIERVDRALRIVPSSSTVVAVCGDHSTSSLTGRHTGDPVPGLISAPGGRSDNVRSFDERSCESGGLSLISANAFITALVDGMNRLSNYRASDGLFSL